MTRAFQSFSFPLAACVLFSSISSCVTGSTAPPREPHLHPRRLPEPAFFFDGRFEPIRLRCLSETRHAMGLVSAPGPVAAAGVRPRGGGLRRRHSCFAGAYGSSLVSGYGLWTVNVHRLTVASCLRGIGLGQFRRGVCREAHAATPFPARRGDPPLRVPRESPSSSPDGPRRSEPAKRRSAASRI
ncbi:Hypothetical protein NGAL_HAMBI1146_29420 [Neorhizobium galegae bv. officinalis]|nr:Hypothetical protein NGAL_HAMBI1146_29420 [Neorhizobium galegae bv. officinalis]